MLFSFLSWITPIIDHICKQWFLAWWACAKISSWVIGWNFCSGSRIHSFVSAHLWKFIHWLCVTSNTLLEYVWFILISSWMQNGKSFGFVVFALATVRVLCKALWNATIHPYQCQSGTNNTISCLTCYRTNSSIKKNKRKRWNFTGYYFSFLHQKCWPFSVSIYGRRDKELLECFYRI